MMTLALLGGIGAQEMLLIFLVVLLLFGANRIPDIAHSLGKGIREFKKAMDETTNELNREINRSKAELEAQNPPPAELASKPAEPKPEGGA